MCFGFKRLVILLLADDIIESQIAEREEEEEAAAKEFFRRMNMYILSSLDFLTASHCDKSPKKSHLEIFKFKCFFLLN